jgi:hypothetical protein
MSQLNLSNLPPEVAFRVLLNLDYPDLLRACQTHRHLNSICQDEYFWRAKTFHDYPNPPNLTMFPQWTWRDLYRHLEQGDVKNVPVYYESNPEPFAHVWVYREDTRGQLFQLCLNQFKRAFPNESVSLDLILKIFSSHHVTSVVSPDDSDRLDDFDDLGKLNLSMSLEHVYVSCSHCHSSNTNLSLRQGHLHGENMQLILSCNQCHHIERY